MDGSDRMELYDVQLVAYGRGVAMCRVDGNLVAVPEDQLLPGTELSPEVSRGRLVVARIVAQELGLVPPIAGTS